MNSLIIFRDEMSQKNINELKKIYYEATEQYYNTEIEKQYLKLTDDEFDIIVELIEKKDPLFNVKEVGFLPDAGKKTNLPFYMGSLNKLKSDNDKGIKNWIKKYTYDEYIIEEKLDGVSALLVYTFPNSEIKETKTELFTRGNGFIGTDISFVIPQINFIPTTIEKLKKSITKIALRGELIISKKNFEEKFQTRFSNPRNLVSGLVHSINPDFEQSVDFVVYQLVYLTLTNLIKSSVESTGKKVIPISDIFENLENMGFKMAKFNIYPRETINAATLSLILNNFKNASDYNIDGIVVQPNDFFTLIEGQNPKNAFAFKENKIENHFQTKVIKVIWNITKYGVLKPKLEVEPVIIDGVTITFVTASNAKNIVDNQIGPGTIIEMVRSGDIIPYITKVISSTKAQMPTESFIWNSTHVDILLSDVEKHQDQISLRRFVDFFQMMDVDNLSDKTLLKIIQTGYKTLFSILQMTLNDFYKIEGFREGGIMANKIYENIQKSMRNRSLLDILTASSALGQNIGRERIKLLLIYIPNLMEIEIDNKTIKNLTEKIQEIPSFGLTLTEIILKNLESAQDFVKKFYAIFPKTETEIQIQNIEIQENVNNETESPFKDMTVVFSNIRNKELKKIIEDGKGNVKDSVTKKTNYLIVATENDQENLTEKIIKAKVLNIPMITLQEFVKKFNIELSV